MSSDQTQQQSDEERRRAQELSLKSSRPPTEVPGYELRRFLGSGAYGEVWVGTDRNTGRHVAIKFYLHRGGVDWSLLSREVEKLVFLSADRYVVQLLDVGWDADPPYYVMEYVENGSLEDYLQREGPLPLGDAVEMFRELAVGLMHAHGKGVLHCDLKPANVLLDQDNKPRLADFGQSRLSSDQTPALGTLFYMAPEQSHMDAVPDARWDVYALGAILYCLLTGRPPHRDDRAINAIETARDLADRLTRYRDVLSQAPKASEHLRVRGMDNALIEIIGRCLELNPERRYANVQEVLDALDARATARTRRPLMLLGIVGPLLLLLIMGVFGWSGYLRAMRHSKETVVEKVHQSNSFAAMAVAEAAAAEIERYFHDVERVAAAPEFQQLLAETAAHPELLPSLDQLRDANLNGAASSTRDAFVEHAARQPLQLRITQLMRNESRPQTASWFACDNRGTQLAAAFAASDPSNTIGRNFAWRTYVHGGDSDLAFQEQRDGSLVTVYRRPPDHQRIEKTHLSAPFQSKATNLWKVAISTPVEHQGKRVGIVALTVDLGVFLGEFNEEGDHQLAVLVDGRLGQRRGMILQHPLFDRVLEQQERLPDRFSEYRVDLDQLTSQPRYVDPLAVDALGRAFDHPWVAAEAPVSNTGLRVIVQENYDEAIQAIEDLGGRLVREGLLALAGVICVVIILWYFVLRAMGEPRRGRSPGKHDESEPVPLDHRTTLPARHR